MRCLTCQSDQPDAAPFCGSCGTPFFQQCVACGHRSEPAARFCIECGARLGQASPNSHDALTSIVDSTRYRPEKKLVTVLFADIVDSTKLIEHLEPDEAATQLNGILASMRAGISRFGGAVNKLQGDGLMAIFGAPIPQEDHAIQACCAAIAIRDSIMQAGQVQVRIGMHTGEAVVQEVSNDLSSQYEAMGIAVHIAARAEQVARPSEIIITDTTLHSARELLEAEALGPRLLKGLSQSINLYSLLAIRPFAASQQFLGGQRISNFVARADSLSELHAHLDRSLSGASKIVGISGDPGVGKSRLGFEFATDCRREGVSVIEARATAHGQTTSLQPIVDLLKSFIGNIRTTSPEGTGLELLTDRLSQFGLAAEAKHLAEFLGISKRDVRGEPTLEIATVALVRRVCRAIGREQSMVILFEDLHWLDAAGDSFLLALIEAFSESRVLLLLSFRPGYIRDWMKSSNYSQITLQPLPREAINDIARELIGADPSTAELRTQIAERSAGNPFFAEEITRALLDRKALTGARGNYSTTEPNAANMLPNTVRGLISFRIDRLDDQQKRFVEAASVVGREFSAEVATEISGIDRSDAQTQIDALLALEMIYSAPQGGLEQLAFKHPLVQEVAYASLVSERRKLLHRRAAKALSSHFSKELNEHAALIARHWEEGGDPIQAASLYMTSATWMGTRDPVQAVRTWKHVRDLTSNLPAEGPSAFMRMMACGQIINLSWRENAAPELLEPIYEEATRLAGQLKDARAGALVTMAYGRALLASGSADDYLSGVKKAQEMLSETPNSSVAALLLAVESHSTGQAGFLKSALQLNSRALERVSDVEVADQRMIGFDVKHWLVALRSRYLMQTGDHAGAEYLIDELLRDTAKLDLTHRAVALGVRVDAAALNRDASRAFEAAGELESIARQNSSPYVSVLTNYFRGIALLVAGENEKAHERLSKALEQAHRDRTGLELEPLMLANLSDSFGNDQATEAIEIANRAQALARRRSQRVAELFALSTKIRILNRAALAVEPALTEEFDRLISVTGAERLRLRTLPTS
nr:adenylate/guanylate cyclase domain-containing protein [Bradyrhizobium sp. JYMT SZCCT0180]